VNQAFIYLASRSPRRAELLRQIGVSHRVLEVEIDETRRAGETPAALVRRLAEDKASAASVMLAGDTHAPILAADTAVVLDDQVFGKPRDRRDGLGMLRRLSGRVHEVMTAVALLYAGRTTTRLSCSEVRFRQLSESERRAYWATGEPADKAGAYAIQGRAAIFIDRLEGSYSGVMGLPLFETAQLLEESGMHWLDREGGSRHR
jgi:septum formation protein